MSRKKHFQDLTFRPAYNLLLITAGAALFAFGIQTVVTPHRFLTGGIYGTSLLVYYSTGALSPGLWFLLLNIPLFLVSWFFVSSRFFFYSLYSMIVVSFFSICIHWDLHIQNQVYAAIAGGFLCGTGGGLVLRSLGSGGGLDVIAVILHQRFNIGIGRFYMTFNGLLLFAFFLIHQNIDLFIASLIVVFVSSTMVEYMLALFNARKLVLIISDKHAGIARRLMDDLQQGATIIKAKGAFSGRDKEVLMVITNNIMLKRLEEAVFTVDPNALFVVENTFNVIGANFGKRKIY
ncbi:MAG: YitT family protein [Thermodesulfobacteriota bacterium]